MLVNVASPLSSIESSETRASSESIPPVVARVEACTASDDEKAERKDARDEMKAGGGGGRARDGGVEYGGGVAIARRFAGGEGSGRDLLAVRESLVIRRVEVSLTRLCDSRRLGRRCSSSSSDRADPSRRQVQSSWRERMGMLLL